MRDVVRLRIEPGHRVLDDSVGAGEIVGDFLRPDEGRRGAEFAGDGSDLLVIGGDDDLVEQSRLLRRRDRIGDYRLAAEQRGCSCAGSACCRLAPG